MAIDAGRPVFTERERIDFSVDRFTRDLAGAADKLVALRQQREVEAVDTVIQDQSAQVQSYFLENEGDFNMLGRVSEFEKYAVDNITPMIEALPDGAEKTKLMVDLQSRTDAFKAQAMRMDFETEVGYAMGKGQEGYKKAFADAISEGDSTMAYGMGQKLMDYNEKLVAHGILKEKDLENLEASLKQGIAEAAVNSALGDSLAVENAMGPAAAYERLSEVWGTGAKAKTLKERRKELRDKAVEYKNEAGETVIVQTEVGEVARDSLMSKHFGALSAKMRDKVMRRLIQLKTRMGASDAATADKYALNREKINEHTAITKSVRNDFYKGKADFKAYEESAKSLAKSLKEQFPLITRSAVRHKSAERHKIDAQLKSMASDLIIADLYQKDPISFLKNPPEAKALSKKYNIPEPVLNKSLKEARGALGNVYNRDKKKVEAGENLENLTRHIRDNAEISPMTEKLEDIDSVISDISEKSGVDLSPIAAIAKQEAVGKSLTGSDREVNFSWSDRKKVQDAAVNLLTKNDPESFLQLVNFLRKNNLGGIMKGSVHFNALSRNGAFVVNKSIDNEAVSDLLVNSARRFQTEQGYDFFYKRISSMVNKLWKEDDGFKKLLMGISDNPSEAKAFVSLMISGRIGGFADRDSWLTDIDVLHDKITSDDYLMKEVLKGDSKFSGFDVDGRKAKLWSERALEGGETKKPIDMKSTEEGLSSGIAVMEGTFNPTNYKWSFLENLRDLGELGLGAAREALEWGDALFDAGWDTAAKFLPKDKREAMGAEPPLKSLKDKAGRVKKHWSGSQIGLNLTQEGRMHSRNLAKTFFGLMKLYLKQEGIDADVDYKGNLKDQFHIDKDGFVRLIDDGGNKIPLRLKDENGKRFSVRFDIETFGQRLSLKGSVKPGWLKRMYEGEDEGPVHLSLDDVLRGLTIPEHLRQDLLNEIDGISEEDIDLNLNPRWLP